MSVGRCVHARAYVLLRCFFDYLSRVAHRTRVFLALFFAIVKRGKITCPRLLVSTSATLHYAVVASPSSWSTGLPLFHCPEKRSTVDHAFIRAIAAHRRSMYCMLYELVPATSVSHIQQPEGERIMSGGLNNDVKRGEALMLTQRRRCAKFPSR